MRRGKKKSGRGTGTGKGWTTAGLRVVGKGMKDGRSEREREREEIGERRAEEGRGRQGRVATSRMETRHVFINTS